MKRMIGVLALAAALAKPSQAQTRDFLYQGCGVWGCATVQLGGTLSYGLPMFGGATEWFYHGLLTASATASSGLTLRTDGWTFNDVVGQEENTHRFAGRWGDIYVEIADFSADFAAPSVSGDVEACASPSNFTCDDGFAEYGTVRLNLVTTTTPEPGALELFATGLLGVAVVARRRMASLRAPAS